MNAPAANGKSSFDPLGFAQQLSTRTAQKPQTVAEIQAGICAAASQPLSRATTLPAQAYTSEEFFAWEVRSTCCAGAGNAWPMSRKSRSRAIFSISICSASL